ncbi:hypothetical protein V8C35DRAFT_300386 [Trichoderma chlorosporum]
MLVLPTLRCCLIARRRLTCILAHSSLSHYLDAEIIRYFLGSGSLCLRYNIRYLRKGLAEQRTPTSQPSDDLGERRSCGGSKAYLVCNCA